MWSQSIPQNNNFWGQPGSIHAQENIHSSAMSLEGIINAITKGFENIKMSSSKKQIRKKQVNYDDILEARDRSVFVDLPELQQNKKIQNLNKIKLWMFKVFKDVFSAAFYFYSRGEMNFEQTQIFCPEKILKNLVRLNEIYKLDKQEFKIIEDHILKYILPYLAKKYPLNDSNQVNKRFQALIEEIDNIEEIQNNYLTYSGVSFEHRQSGNYYDLIMELMNEIFKKIETLNQINETVYEQFQSQMKKTFDKVYDFNWMNGIEQKNIKLNQQQSFREDEQMVEKQVQKKSPKKSRKQENKQQQKEISLKQILDVLKTKPYKNDKKQERKKQRDEIQIKKAYKAKVSEYTSYLIGRKIPKNIPQFSNQQLNHNKITIKHPTVLRVLTKWFQQLLKKFDKNYFSNRSQSIQIQKSNIIIDLKPSYKRLLDQMMSDQKKQFDKYFDKIKGLNYKLQQNLTFLQYQFKGQGQMQDLQRISGKFAKKIVKCMHLQIVQLLNRIIHSILTVAQKFHKQVKKQGTTSQSSNWPHPPNLLSFKLGDLLRCKCTSNEEQIIKLYNEINRMGETEGNSFKIIRIKNRLRESTSDILINIRFKQKYLCEIQLSIKTKVSDFIKKSNSFQHYLYELSRSQFGPVFQLCSIWMSLDTRSKLYQNLIEEEVYDKQTNFKDFCQHKLVSFQEQQSFICNSCNEIYLHGNFILNHLRCSICCQFYECMRCYLRKNDKSEQKLQQIKSKIIFNDKKYTKNSTTGFNIKHLKNNCIKPIQKWQDFQKESTKYGISIYIQSKKTIIKPFKLLNYDDKLFLLSKKEKEFIEVAEIKNKHQIRQFMNRNICIQIKETQDILKFDDLSAVKEYMMVKIAKQKYKKFKQTINLTIKSINKVQSIEKLNSLQCRKILMVGQQNQRKRVKNIFASDNDIEYLPMYFEDFPNLQWIVLSRNPIKSFKGIQNFKKLKIFIIENENQAKRQTTQQIDSELHLFGELPELQKFVLSYYNFELIPDNFRKLKKLKNLQLQNCQISDIEPLFECQSLQILNLSKNKLTFISPNIGKLKNLSILVLSRNSIENLPNFRQIYGETVPSLMILDLSCCSLSTIEQSLSCLTKLQKINLSDNSIFQIHKNALRFLINLKQINLSSNKLTELPIIQNCVKLNKLYISENDISELPAQLSKLQLDEFRFEGCSIKKISCIDWLKSRLNNNVIEQKYNYQLQKYPDLQAKISYKYVTDLEEKQDDTKKLDVSKLKHLFSTESLKLQPTTSNNIFEESINIQQSINLQNSQSSLSFLRNELVSSIFKQKQIQKSNEDLIRIFFSRQHKRFLQKQEDEKSDRQSEKENSEGDVEQIKNVQFESDRLQNMNNLENQRKITNQLISEIFDNNELIVCDYLKKIKYSRQNILYHSEFNLFFDQNQIGVIQKFKKLVRQSNFANEEVTVYFYAANLLQNLEKIKQIINNNIFNASYFDLFTKNKNIKFSFTGILKNKKIQLRRMEEGEIPDFMIKKDLEKIFVKKIKKLPQILSDCTNIKFLVAKKCNISVMPLYFGGFTKLTYLSLINCNLKQVDVCIFNLLFQLKSLNVSNNKLIAMPFVQKCVKLQKVDISGNLIFELPIWLQNLRNVKFFQFNNCPIRFINCIQFIQRTLDNHEAIKIENDLLLKKRNNKKEVELQWYKQECIKINKNQIQQLDFKLFNPSDHAKFINFFRYHIDMPLFSSFFNLNQEIFIKYKSTIVILKDTWSIKMFRTFQYYYDALKNMDTINKIKKYFAQNNLLEVFQNNKCIQYVQIPSIKKKHQCKINNCNNKLQYPLFWLKWEFQVDKWMAWQESQDQFACFSCIKDYQSNCVLLPKDNLFKKMIPEQHFGKNYQPVEFQIYPYHKFICSSCEKPPNANQARYLCLGCMNHPSYQQKININLCQTCINDMLFKQKQALQGKNVAIHQNHPLLRIRRYNQKGEI